MKTGQRINLLKKIATKMAEAGFTDGDLILRQFKLPHTDNWYGNGGPYEYYLDMLQGGEDENLVELHEYLFPEDNLPSGASKTNDGHWKKNWLRLFISHSTTKKMQVAQIKNELKEYGIDCFVAHEDIQPTAEWLIEIRAALNSCHALVAVLCTDFKTSNFCDQEVGFVLQRNVPVIPLRLQIDPYGFISPIQGVNCFNRSPAEIANEIERLLSQNPATRPIAIRAKETATALLVDNFLQSSNFKNSTNTLKKIEALATIPESLVKKLANEWSKNDQIKDCLGIPGRMNSLLSKHGEKHKT